MESLLKNSRVLFAAGLLAGVMAILIYYGGDDGGNGDRPQTSGHQKMLAKLAVIATDSDNAFFGDASINRARAQLLSVRPGDPGNRLEIWVGGQ